MTEPHPQGVLQPGYRLLWYRIGRILGRGAFGTTYLAEDINLHRPVAIKEFFPSQYCSRQTDSTEVRPLSDASADDFKWAMERFLSEARTLARFEHPNIIRVLNVFEENGTAYMVMHYESGISLSALLKKRRTLNQQELSQIAIPILDGLEKVHASGFIHRDIKPSNIYLREGGSPVLLDFGSARQSMQEYTQTLTSLVSPGYAPIEQYTSKGDRQGPWTDIYGMGATLYRAVTGLVPPSAVDRSEVLSEGKEDYMTKTKELARAPYSDAFLNAIDHALAFSVEQRPRSIADWRTEFGFNLTDIDTQPEHGNRHDHHRPAAEEVPGRQHEVSDNEIINIAGGETKTAVMTQPTVETDTVAADTESERPTEPTPATTSHQHINRRSIMVAGGVVALLATTGVYFGMDTGDVSTSPIATTKGDIVVPNTMATDGGEASNAGEISAFPVSSPRHQVQALLDAARQDLEAMRLTTPADNNAHTKFRQVLSLDPDNADAKDGLETIYRRYLAMARHAIEENQFERAGTMLDRAATVMPDAPDLMRTRVRLEQKRTEIRMKSLADALRENDGNDASAADDTDGQSKANDGVGRVLEDGKL